MKVDRTYLPVNMALAIFRKQFKKNRNISEWGIGKIRVFFCIVLPIGIAYWPLFIPLGITRAYSFRLESLGPIVLPIVLPIELPIEMPIEDAMVEIRLCGDWVVDPVHV